MTTYRENWRAWAKDLRSGVPQSTGLLHHVDMTTGDTIGFCCLGRVCILAGLKPKWVWHKGSDSVKYGNRGASAVLPAEGYKYLGIHVDNPVLAIPPRLRDKAHGENHLAATALNDRLRFTFPEIADCIIYTIRAGRNLKYVTIPANWDAEYDIKGGLSYG